MRTVGVFLSVYAVVLAALLAAVGQLGGIDHQALIAVLSASAVAAGVGAWRSARRQP